MQNANNFAAGSIADVTENGEQIITDLKINGNVLNGGSTSITVTSIKQLDTLLLQIDGEEGYYKFPLTDTNWINKEEGSTTEYIYYLVLEFDQEVPDNDELTFTISGITKSGEVAKPKEKTVKAEEAETGAMQISVSWDRDDDLDLHVITPSNERIYFANGDRNLKKNGKMLANGGDGKGMLDIDSNPACSIDHINSENIFFEKEPLEDGDYKVEVHLYERCNSDAYAKSGARYNVTLNIDGKFYNFAFGKQSGKFDKEDTSKKNEIGIIKIRNGKCDNCD